MAEYTDYPKGVAIDVPESRTFNTDEMSKRADPEWDRDRNYMPAYKFSKGRKFVDHRDNVYQVDDMPADQDGR